MTKKKQADQKQVDRKQIERMSFTMTPEMAEAFDLLATHTRIPKAILCREAIADLLAKHADKLREASGMSNRLKE